MTTAAVVAYHRQEKEVRISYAGHPPVLHKGVAEKTWSYIRPFKRKGLRDGSPLNVPIAIDSDTRYTELKVPMVPGDRFFIYTDGIIEAPNVQGEPFGFTRLKDVLDEDSNAPLADLKTAVFGKLNRYTEKRLNHDDVTLIALEIC